MVCHEYVGVSQALCRLAEVADSPGARPNRSLRENHYNLQCNPLSTTNLTAEIVEDARIFIEEVSSAKMPGLGSDRAYDRYLFVVVELTSRTVALLPPLSSQDSATIRCFPLA